MSSEPFGTFAPSNLQAAIIDLVRATPILRRGTFRPFVAKLLARLRSGPIDLERDGVKFRMVFDDNPIEWGIALMPGYEGSELSFLREGLKDGSTFVDIGANIGLYGLSLASTVGPHGRVLAIEADPVAQGRLAENARLNAWPQLAVVQAAAGDHDGEARFAAKRNFAHSKITPDGDVIVPMRTLASILAEQHITRIDALKIDVEGYEDQVLRPFFRTAPRSLWPGRVAIEDIFIDKSADNCVKLMKSLGYREAGRKRINAFLVLDDRGAR